MLTGLRSLFSGRLGKSFSIYSFGRIISALVSMFLLPVFTKVLPKTEFGIVGILWLVNPLLLRFTNLGMNIGVYLKFFKLDHKTLSSYLHNALCGITLFSLVIWFIGVWKIQWIQLIIAKDMTRVIFSLFFCSILFTNYIIMTQGLLRMEEKAAYYVIMTILPQIVTTITTYILIIYVEKSYTSYVMGMALGSCICGVIGLIYLFKQYPIKYFYPSSSILKNLLRIGLPVFPGTVGGIILASGDRYVIKYFLGLEAVAVYTYGYRFAEYILTSLFQPFGRALGPIILDKAAANFKEASLYNSKIIFASLCFFPLLLSAIIIPFKDIMTLLGSKGYGPSYLIYLISLFGILLYNTSQLNGVIFNHLERTECSMIVVLSGAVMNVGLNIWLVPKYGIVAAAFTTVVCYLFMLSFTIFMVNHFISIKISLFQIILRLTPLLFYLICIWYLDFSLQGISLWQTYIVKLGLFSLLTITTLLIFPEGKKIFIFLRSGYKNGNQLFQS